MKKLLIYGIGNVGRQDDGLGIRLIEHLEHARENQGSVEGTGESLDVAFQSAYQLNVEDALEISEYDCVLFVDATVEKSAKAPFEIRKLQPSNEIAFSTHAMSMEGILALCDQLYERTPKAFVLTIPGYEWEVAEKFSVQAHQNFEATVQKLTAWLAHTPLDLDSLLL